MTRGPASDRLAHQAKDAASGDAFHTLSIADKARLAAEIVLCYGRVRLALRSSDVTRVVADLRAPARGSRPRILQSADEGRRLGAAVIRTLEPLPFDSRCLVRSLVLLRLLSRRGQEGALVIAVRPGESGLAAHAWVEADGQPLLPPADADHGRLVAL